MTDQKETDQGTTDDMPAEKVEVDAQLVTELDELTEALTQLFQSFGIKHDEGLVEGVLNTGLLLNSRKEQITHFKSELEDSSEELAEAQLRLTRTETSRARDSESFTFTIRQLADERDDYKARFFQLAELVFADTLNKETNR